MQMCIDCSIKLEQLKRKLLPENNPSPRSSFFSVEEIIFVRNAIQELPEHEQVILYMRFWENYSTDDITHFCKISKELLRSIMNEAIRKLRLKYIIEFSSPQRRSYVA